MKSIAELTKTRGFYRIRAFVESLCKSGVSLDQAARLARGYSALKGHERLLSDSGRQLLKQLSDIKENTFAQGVLANRVEEFLPLLPTVSDPKLSLFVLPSDRLSAGEIAAIKKLLMQNEARKGYRALQINKGCFNQCLMCGYDASKRVVYMPYPMILAVAREFFVEKDSMMVYLDSDPIQYRDKAFNADFGDVAKMLIDLGRPPRIVTHGWLKGDRYAKEAAQKIHDMERRIEIELSVHLLHKELLSDPERIGEYVDRFREAIELLEPRGIRLMGLPDAVRAPEIFKLSFLKGLFGREIGRGFDLSKSTIDCYYPSADRRGMTLVNKNDLRFLYGNNRSIDGGSSHFVFRPSGTFNAERNVVTRSFLGGRTITEIYGSPENVCFKYFLIFLSKIPERREIPNQLEDLVFELRTGTLQEFHGQERLAYFFDKCKDIPVPMGDPIETIEGEARRGFNDLRQMGLYDGEFRAFVAIYIMGKLSGELLPNQHPKFYPLNPWLLKDYIDSNEDFTQVNELWEFYSKRESIGVDEAWSLFEMIKNWPASPFHELSDTIIYQDQVEEIIEPARMW